MSKSLESGRCRSRAQWPIDVNHAGGGRVLLSDSFLRTDQAPFLSVRYSDQPAENFAYVFDGTAVALKIPYESTEYIASQCSEDGELR